MTANRIPTRAWNAWNNLIFWLLLPWWILCLLFEGDKEETRDPYGDEGWAEKELPKPSVITRTWDWLVEAFFFGLSVITFLVMAVVVAVVGSMVCLFVLLMDLITSIDLVAIADALTAYSRSVPTLAERFDPTAETANPSELPR